ncbi:copper resistance protein CopC [Plantactinospora sp. GCM10030261]|uniref:copper resistance CopC family protein n=1 Tax=Plantactinospora sp. GCM10030261 TaxID=3273420 RepID=UPI00360D2AC7
MLSPCIVRRARRRLVPLVGLLAAAAALLAGPLATPALAEPVVLQTVPEADTTVTEPVDDVIISINQQIERGRNEKVEVIGTDGTTYQEGRPRVLGGINLSQKTRELPPGDYRVTWTAVLAGGEVGRGEFSFTVAVPEDDEAAADSPGTEVAAGAGPPPPGSSYDAGNAGVWLVLALIGLGSLSLSVLLFRRRLKREMELPSYNPYPHDPW